MSDIDLVIFDCDGVLADIEVLSAETVIAELALGGVALDHAYVFQHFIGRSLSKATENIRSKSEVALPADFEARYRSSLANRFAAEPRPTPGLHSMTRRLTCRSCDATSSTPLRVRLTLHVLGLTHRFGPHVFAATQVGHGKPAPDLVHLAADRMAVTAERYLLIEDSALGGRRRPRLRNAGLALFRRGAVPSSPRSSTGRTRRHTPL